MGLLKRVLGPRSKYDKTLPYTYVAKYATIEGGGEYLYYFSNTICGLIECLDTHDLAPETVELFGVYREEEIPIPKEPCVDADGNWLKRPDICRSLERKFEQTREARFKGHIEKGICSFDDRDREGEGPC
jgi:hypothetical protein